LGTPLKKKERELNLLLLRLKRDTRKGQLFRGGQTEKGIPK